MSNLPETVQQIIEAAKEAGWTIGILEHEGGLQPFIIMGDKGIYENITSHIPEDINLVEFSSKEANGGAGKFSCTNPECVNFGSVSLDVQSIQPCPSCGSQLEPILSVL